MTEKERYQNYKDRGICVYCKSSPAEDGKTTCRICREKQRKQTAEKRAALRNMGFCSECGKNRIFGEEKICPECAAKKYASNRKNADKEKNREYFRERTKKLKAEGICVKCGKRAAEKGKTRCMICNIKEANRAHRAKDCLPRSERPAYGLCYFCGTEIKDGKVCEKCKKRISQNLPKTNPNECWRSQDKARIAAIMAGRKEKTVGSDNNVRFNV